MLPTKYSIINHIYTYDLALNNPQMLTCHEIQPKQTGCHTKIKEPSLP